MQLWGVKISLCDDCILEWKQDIPADIVHEAILRKASSPRSGVLTG